MSTAKPAPRVPGEPAASAAADPEPVVDPVPAVASNPPETSAEATELDAEALLADKNAEIAELRAKLAQARAGRDQRDNAGLPEQKEFKGKKLPRAVLTADGWLAPNVVRNVPAL